jgi:hypothetical protein
MQFGNGVRAEHTVFVAPEWYAGAGAQFNAKEYITALRESHVNCVEFYVKDHHGVSYYKTQVGIRSSYMQGDYLADLCREASAQGIAVIAYFSICWDNSMATQNPAWLMRTPEGDPILARYWSYLCINTPYRDYMLQQLAEIAHYAVQGFWLDILRFPELFRRGCFCQFCQRKFCALTHHTPPSDLDPHNPLARAYRKFQENSITSFLRDVKTVVGGKGISFNGAGFQTPKAWNDLCAWHNVESHAPEYSDQSYKSRYLSSLRKPWEILTPGNNAGWTAWSAKPADAMMLELAIAVSHGGTVTFGINPSIQGTTGAPRTNATAQRRALAVVYGSMKAMEPWIAGGEKIANIALLQTLATHEALFGGHANPGLDQDIPRAKNARQPLEAFPREVILEAMGWHKALYDRGFQYAILPEYALDRMEEYELIILPDQRYLPSSVMETLRDFVNRGGKLIATAKTSLYDHTGQMQGNFALSDLFGVDMLDVSEYTTNYVDPVEHELAQGLSDYMIPLHQQSLIIQVREQTKILAHLQFPDTERSETRFFFHEHSGPDPRGVRKLPLITQHTVGKGAVFYVAVPMGREFFLREDPSVGEILRNLVRMTTQRMVSSTNGVGLEMNLTYHPARNQVLLHLVNHYTPRVEPFLSCRTVRHLEVEIAEPFLQKYLGKDIARISEIPGNIEKKWERRNGKISFTVDRIEIYTIVVFAA